MVGRKGGGRPKMTWRRQEENHTEQVGVKKDDTTDRMKWRNGACKLLQTRDESGQFG